MQLVWFEVNRYQVQSAKFSAANPGCWLDGGPRMTAAASIPAQGSSVRAVHPPAESRSVRSRGGCDGATVRRRGALGGGGRCFLFGVPDVDAQVSPVPIGLIGACSPV